MAVPVVYNLRSLFRRPMSSFATILGVGLVVAVLIGALSLAAGFQATVVSTGSPDNAIVVRRSATDEISSGISRDAANVLLSSPAVAAGPDGKAVASSDVVVLINLPRRGQEGTSNVVVRGVDTPGAFQLRDQVEIVDGRRFEPGAAEVVVGERISRRFANCEIGDRLRFGQRDFTVVGHFTADGTGFESEIWGDNATLMPVFRGEVFQSVTFRMAEPAGFEAAKRALEADPRLQVDVRREREFYDAQSGVLATVIRFAGVAITLIMAVGAIFGAMNTMYAAVGHRTREIAVLLTLGFSPFAVFLSFLAESVLLALLGGVVGCLLALPINGITTSTTNWATFSELAFAFRVTPPSLVAGMVFAGLLGVAGGLLPAWRAARQPLAAGLRAL